MALFSKEQDEGRINVHEMQTMWYENHAGLAFYRKGEYRLALKNYSYIEKHLKCMLEDSSDFQHYSFRKGSVNHYIQMIQFTQNIWAGRYPVASCIGMLRAASKMRKGAAGEGGLEKMKKERQSYVDSDEYAVWKEQHEKRDEDEDYVRSDPDPEGWAACLDAAQGNEVCAFKYATNVSRWNQKDGELQAKCVNFFIQINKPDEALSAVRYLLTNSPRYAKTTRAVARFQEYAKSATFKQADKLKEFQDFVLPKYVNEKSSDTDAQNMLHAHEMVKLDNKNAKLTISALETDKDRANKVYLAMKTHQRLVKIGDEETAKEYFAKAQEVYPFSTYFEGSKADLK